MYIPIPATQHLLIDAMARDRTTARRKTLFEALWRERYITRMHLIERVQYKLGSDTYGELAWEDTFYRHMRVVKKAFQSADFELVYSRSKDRPGYYLKGQATLHEDVLKQIAGSVREVDKLQIDAFKNMTVQDRLSISIRMSDEIYQASRNAKQTQTI